jgi:hypothetical protein
MYIHNIHIHLFVDNLRVVTTEGEVVDALVRSAEVSMRPSATQLLVHEALSY